MPNINVGFSKIKDHDDLIRNNFNGMILFNDRDKLASMKAARQQERIKEQRISTLETKVESLETKLDLIIDLLKSK